MSAVSKWGNPLPEGCHIFLDLRQLPEAQDGSDDLVPLSPFTIEWGVDNPWDETNPAVLNITLIDQGGRYSKSANGLMGHRLTVRPAWELQGTYNESPLCFALFDGYVTDVQMLDHDAAAIVSSSPPQTVSTSFAPTAARGRTTAPTHRPRAATNGGYRPRGRHAETMAELRRHTSLRHHL